MRSHKIDLMSHFSNVTPYFRDLNRKAHPRNLLLVLLLFLILLLVISTCSVYQFKETHRQDRKQTRLFNHQASAQINFYSTLMTFSSPSDRFLVVFLPSYTLRDLQHHRIHLNGSISEGNYHNGSHFGATKIHSHSLLLQVPRICEIDLNTNNGGCGWQAMNGVAPR